MMSHSMAPANTASSTPALPIANREIRLALTLIVRDSLRPVAWGLGLLYLIFAASHILILPPPIKGGMAALALTTGGALLVLAYRLGRQPLAIRAVNPVGAALAGAVLINSLVHLYLTATPEQTTNLALLVIGVGSFFLSTRWFAAMLAATVGGWLAVLALVPPAAGLHFAFMLLTALVLAGLIHAVRLRTFRHLVILRLQATRRQHDLEKTLAALGESEHRFRRLAEATLEGIIIHAQGRILDVNQAVTTILGYPAEALYGREALEFIAPAWRPQALQHMQAGDETPYEVRGLRSDGTTVPLELCGKTISVNGRVARVVAIRDITEQRRVEEALAHALEAAQAANRAKSAFLANMSHELRTPLNAIIGYSEILLDAHPPVDPAELAADLGKIRAAGYQLLEWLDSILTLARLEAGQRPLVPAPVVVADFLGEIQATAQPWMDKRHNRLTVGGTLQGSLLTDPAVLRQILLNLLNNAAKFTENGTVNLTVAQAWPAGQEVWQFTVCDTGIGIAPEYVDQLFRPFAPGDPSASRKYEGAGLGLALSQRLCQLLHGTIQVESTPGHGATFTVSVPVLSGAPEDTRDAPPEFAVYPPRQHPAICDG